MDHSEFIRGFIKEAAVTTKLKPHQQRVVDRMREQDGLVVAHGLGSGKTLTSIAAAEDLGGDTTVLAPASLVTNYQKELKAHTGRARKSSYNIKSHAKATREAGRMISDMLIVDEAHRLRETTTKGNKKVKDAVSKKRMLLTATPIYNHPSDAAALVNLAAGKAVFPSGRTGFSEKYIRDEVVQPKFLDRLRGVRPGSVQKLKNTRDLQHKLKKWVDYHANSTEGFPTRVDESVDTKMTKSHSSLLDGLMRDADPLFARKVRAGLPPSKQEMRQLNAFMGAVRQASNVTQTYSTTLNESPKIDVAVSRLIDATKKNKNHRAVVYSNYLDSGVNRYAKKLEAAGVPHALFTGKVPKKKRDQAVADYNSGKIKALLVSAAGGEGLDLKGTRQMQILDPHWNQERINQVIGRGIRYKSHAHLPPKDRTVRVEKYYAVNKDPHPILRFFGKKRPTSPDEYLNQIATRKDNLNRQVTDLMGSQHKSQGS